MEKNEAHHLRKTLRLGQGERCLVTDGKGKEAEARIEGFFSDGRARLILEKMITPGDCISGLILRAYVAVLQKNKLDYLIEKSQELGVQEFVPLETQRTTVKMSEQSCKKVLLRWNKIAREAAKQSGSLELIKISPPRSFEKSLSAVPSNEKIVIFHPQETAIPFSEWISPIQSASPFNLFWGPEGGFTEKEIDSAKRFSGCRVVNLGKRILKADTAYLGVLASLRFLFL